MNELVRYDQDRRSPEAVTKDLRASLKPPVKSLLREPVNRDYVDPTYGWDGYVTGYGLPMTIEARNGPTNAPAPKSTTSCDAAAVSLGVGTQSFV